MLKTIILITAAIVVLIFIGKVLLTIGLLKWIW